MRLHWPWWEDVRVIHKVREYPGGGFVILGESWTRRPCPPWRAGRLRQRRMR
jgi:hypothetical protein